MIAFGSALLILTLLSVVWFALTNRIVIGSEHIKSESRAVASFTQVDLAGSGSMTIQQGSVESLTVTAEDNILPYIHTDVSNGRLTVGENTGFFAGIFIPREPIHYQLTVTGLDTLIISGSGSITVDTINTPNLFLEIGGSGEIDIAHVSTSELDTSIGGSGSVNLPDVTTNSVVSKIGGSGAVSLIGQAQDVKVIVGGSGSFHARGLSSTTADVTIGGSGDVTLTVSSTLHVTVSGAGNVTYCGNPVVTQSVSGSGTIQHC